jgi:DNA-binding NarL/FixJ family response regulator
MCRVLHSLEPELREVVPLRLAGFTNKEIAARLGRVEKTVERKLGMIRARWLQHGSRGPAGSSP